MRQRAEAMRRRDLRFFPLHDGRRPRSERKAAGRYREPGLFAGLERDG
jgi:hypothetical protein